MKQELRDPKIDPRPRDKVEHIDGGTMHVLYRSPKMVGIVRKRGDFHLLWMRLSTFTKVAR